MGVMPTLLRRDCHLHRLSSSSWTQVALDNTSALLGGESAATAITYCHGRRVLA